MGITAVPRVNLVISLVCRHVLLSSGSSQEPVVIGGFNAHCLTGEVSSETALFASYGTFIAGVLSAVMSTVLNKLSDRVGRVKIIFVSMIGLVTSEIIIVVVAKLPELLDYRFYYLAYAADGLGYACLTASNKNI